MLNTVLHRRAAERARRLIATLLLVWLAGISRAEDGAPLDIAWKNNYLTIEGPSVPGGISIHYLEAYCRAGSTDRDWHETVIPHRAELVDKGGHAGDGRGPEIRLRDTLADGVVVDHVIRAESDNVRFELTARNPTNRASQAHWAQPCIRVDKFTGHGVDDARDVVPAYARKCFLFVDGRLTRMPTEPWATKARYVPGQVYCPRGVDRNDVNPRPLSALVPSNGLTGCYSADERTIMAVAFEPYQEIFQGVIACIHNDFRIGGLQPGETKTIRGRIYIVPADVDRLIERYTRDLGPAR
ncbi:MAG: hypothetical protein FJ297_10515 [Planctomycetes bacterium]|nr:hypothetical protein [Planctomycetota bacterium]